MNGLIQMVDEAGLIIASLRGIIARQEQTITDQAMQLETLRKEKEEAEKEGRSI